MKQVGLGEFTKRARHYVLHEVCQKHGIIPITDNGTAIARLVPVGVPESSRNGDDAVWAAVDELTKEIAAHWPADVSATQAVREQRREL